MTALTRTAALALAEQIRVETTRGGNTPERVGSYLKNMVDSTVFIGEAQTPPTAGNGLTGTNVFSVLPNGATLDVSASGVKVADQAANSVLGRAGATPGAVAAIVAAVDGHVLRLAGATLAFGTLTSAAYADGSVTTVKILDANVTLAKMANMATDSLLGRDTAGSGVPEVIGLNATLSMTGAGALQRAALSGVVAAAAGSNTTTYSSADFGSLPVSTTGTFTCGTGTKAVGGDIRMSASWSLYGLVSTTDTPLIQWNGATPRLILGDSSGFSTAYIYLQGGNIGQLRAGTNPTVQWGASTFTVLAGATNRLRTDGTGLGLYAAPPVAQAARPGQLTDNSGGTPSGTIAAIGAAYVQAEVRDAVASLAAKVNSMESKLSQAAGGLGAWA